MQDVNCLGCYIEYESALSAPLPMLALMSKVAYPWPVQPEPTLWCNLQSETDMHVRKYSTKRTGSHTVWAHEASAFGLYFRTRLVMHNNYVFGYQQNAVPIFMNTIK